MAEPSFLVRALIAAAALIRRLTPKRLRRKKEGSYDIPKFTYPKE
ncbi:MAG: hypothetical protein ACPGOV_11980 [Magnetovibrionaceae bacterium]